MKQITIQYNTIIDTPLVGLFSDNANSDYNNLLT